MIADFDHSTTSEKGEDTPANRVTAQESAPDTLRITLQPLPLPDDFPTRLARIYDLALRRYQAWLASEGAETIAPDKREGGDDGTVAA